MGKADSSKNTLTKSKNLSRTVFDTFLQVIFGNNDGAKYLFNDFSEIVQVAVLLSGYPGYGSRYPLPFKLTATESGAE